MAKLDDINYGGKERAPRTLGPGAAVQGFQNKQNVINAAFAVGDKFAQMKTETDLIEADADHRTNLIRYEQFLAENPTASKEQLDELAAELGDTSLFNNLDTTAFDARGEEKLPAFVWQTVGMEGVMRQSIANNAEKINSFDARQKWEASARENQDRVISSMIERTGNDAVAYEMDRVSRLVSSALQSRQIERASALLESPIWELDPTSRQLYREKLVVAEKHRDVEQMLFTAREPDDYDDILDQVTNPSWSEGLPSNDVLRIANSVITQKSRAQQQEQAETERMQDAYAMDTLVRITTGEFNMADVNARVSVLGMQNHARMVSAARTMSREGIATDPAVERGLQTDILALRSGISLDPSDTRSFRERQSAIKVGIMDAMGDGSLAGDAAMRLLKESESAVEFPYKTEAYTAAQKELDLLIVGTPDGGFNFMAPDDARAMRAKAGDDLRRYIENNGGANADIDMWRKEKLPLYTNEVAQKVMYGIPEGAHVERNPQTNYADVDLTAAWYADEATKMQKSIKAGDGQYTQQKYDALLQNFDRFNTWWDTVGAHHAPKN